MCCSAFFVKYFTNAFFIIGAVTVGGYAIAIPNNVPVVKACIDNKTKALYVSSNGSCPKGRSAVDIGATGANVKSIRDRTKNHNC